MQPSCTKGPQISASIPLSQKPEGSVCVMSTKDVVGRIVAPTLTCNIPQEYDMSIYAAQYQPTERPIEDRFSLTFDPSQKRLIIGVYDGAPFPLSMHFNNRILQVTAVQRHRNMLVNLCLPACSCIPQASTRNNLKTLTTQSCALSSATIRSFAHVPPIGSTMRN